MIAEFCGRAILRASVAALRKDLSADRFGAITTRARTRELDEFPPTTVRDLARRGDVFDGVGDGAGSASLQHADGRPTEAERTAASADPWAPAEK